MPNPAAPRSLCLLRLSALGDVTHVLPLLHTLRSAWPEVAVTWAIGKGERRLLDGLPGVRFVEYDKKSGIKGMRALRRDLGERFDVLLQLQVSARANLLSAFIPAKRRIGYDRSRSKDGHGLFINERIADRPGIHVLDAISSFAEALGLHAASNPNRSGPYSDRRYCVDRYDDAARKFRGKPASELKWGSKIEAEGVMDLVTVDDAIAAFERYRADFR